MRSSPRALALPVALALVVGGAALADDDNKGGKKTDAKEEAPSLNDLFGDTLSTGSSVKDLEAATQGLEGKTSGGGLRPKTEIADPDASVSFLSAFAAERIVITKKEGCIPGDAMRTKVVSIEIDQLPGPSPKFSTCVSMASKAGRQMRLTAAIVDARNRRVAKAEGVVDFTGKPRLDYVLDFPPVPFRMAGPHLLVIDLEGKPAAKLPLFEVKVTE